MNTSSAVDYLKVLEPIPTTIDEEKEFRIEDYDFDFEDKPNPAIHEITIPPEVEMLRIKMGNRVLKAFAANSLGIDPSRIVLNEIYYNRDYNLEVEAEVR